jgi:hypothetical protein
VLVSQDLRWVEVSSQTLASEGYFNRLSEGYSWFSNQYGLTIDTIQAFELVLPNGTITRVTESTYPDLFFGMKASTSLHRMIFADFFS